MAATDTPTTGKDEPQQLSREQQMLNDVDALTGLLHKMAQGPQATQGVGDSPGASVDEGAKKQRPEPTREQRLETAKFAHNLWEENVKKYTEEVEKLTKRQAAMNRNAVTRYFYKDELQTIPGSIEVAKQHLKETKDALEKSPESIDYLENLVKNPHLVEEKKPEAPKREVKPERILPLEVQLNNAQVGQGILENRLKESREELQRLTKRQAQMNRNALTRYYYKDKLQDMEGSIQVAKQSVQEQEKASKSYPEHIESLQKQIAESQKQGPEKHRPSVGEMIHGHDHGSSWADQMKHKMRQAMDGLHEVAQKSQGPTPPDPEDLQQLKALSEKLEKNQALGKGQGNEGGHAPHPEVDGRLGDLVQALHEFEQGPQMGVGQKAGDPPTLQKHVSTGSMTHLSAHHEGGPNGEHVGQKAHVHAK